MSKPQEPASGKSEPQPAWMARGEALVHRATQLSTQREQLDKDLEALVSEALAWLRSLSMEERMDASCHALLHRLHQGVFASCRRVRRSARRWAAPRRRPAPRAPRPRAPRRRAGRLPRRHAARPLALRPRARPRPRRQPLAPAWAGWA